jgi:PKD repeat protein
MWTFIDQRKEWILTLSFLLVGTFAGSAMAQVGEIPMPVLTDVRVETTVSFDPAKGWYTYAYTVTNPAANTGKIWLIEVDVAQPPGGQSLDSNGLSIPLGGDQYPFSQELADLQPMNMPVRWTVVPFGQRVPSGWDGGLARSGFSNYSSGNETSNIMPGASLSGFDLISPGLPVIRPMNIEPWWVLVTEEEATEEESLAAGEIERQIVFHTYALGPSAVKPGWFEHWDQLRDNLNQAIGLDWIPDTALASTLVSQLTSARQAADVHDGTLAKSRLQPILDTLAPTTRAQIRQEGYDLVFYNVKKLIEATLDTPIPVEPKVRLTPEHSQLPLGDLYTLTATVENLANQNTPIPDYPLIFQVVEGPHAGIDMIGSTDSLGKIDFSYTGEFQGTDKIVAGIGEGGFIIEPLGSADVTWTGGSDLVILSFIPPLIRSQGGQPILVTETTGNAGNLPAGPSITRYFLSVDSFIDPFEDRPIGERAVPGLGPEEFHSVSLLEIRLPGDLPAGTYYVGACADAEGVVVELNEDNNCELNQIAIPLEGSPGDGIKPESQVLSLTAYQTLTPFNVEWSGTDEGSGISDFSILVSENGGPYTEWLSHTTDTTGTFPGRSGITYDFYSVARDQAGNQEDPPVVPDTVTMVDTTPPLISVVQDPLPNANGWNNSDLTVTFTCSDGESVIATCPAPVTVSTEGAGQTINGTAFDLAGNSASASLLVNLDKTVPELTMPIFVPQYSYLQNVLLNFGAQDALSGIDGVEAMLNGLPVNSNDMISLNHVGPNVFTLSASDRAGNGSTQSLSFEVINTPPTAEAGGPYTMDEGSSGPLDGSGSSDPDGNPITYAWDLDNNGLYNDSTQVNPSFSQPDNGTFTVGLEVSDVSMTRTDTATVTVLNVAPAVNAGSDQTVNAGTTVGFSGSFTDTGAGDTHTIHWDFGDGTSVDGTLTPTHPYPSAGTYTATLAVTDDDGGIGSDSLLVTVNPVQTIFNLAARAKPTKIDLTWTCVSGNVTYNIYRSTTQGGPYQQITSGHVSTYCAYADFGLTNGVTYYYRVTSVGETGLESLYSNEASATPNTR